MDAVEQHPEAKLCPFDQAGNPGRAKETMSVQPIEALRVPTDDVSAVPLYFDSGERRLFAWLHQAAAGTVEGLGVVICKPFGYEALCAHRSVRAFAEATAALGLPTLRFDYSGMGDSSDIDASADQIDTWLNDIVAAVEELRRRTGVERVCLFGLRLGALLATLAAARCDSVVALIAVAPVISGGRYLRELRTTRLAALLGAEAAEWASTPGEAQPGSTDSLEFSGYAMSAATTAALARADVTALASPTFSELLVIDRDDLPAAKVWTQRLAGLGVRTRYDVLPGFVEMMMMAPQFAVVPKAMIATVGEWLTDLKHRPLQNLENSKAAQKEQLATFSEPGVLPLYGDSSVGEVIGAERPVVIGSAAPLFGIVTEPRAREVSGAVILLNVGADYHIGASRMYVSLARRWVQRGYVVLRLDLAGLGDSGTRLGRPDNEVFPPAAIDDIDSAMEFLCGRYGVRDITLAGMCSGAYHALRAAVAGLPTNRILMVNPQNFFWKEGMSLQTLQLAEVVRNPGVYRERALSAKAWRRLLTGRVNIWRIAKIYVHRSLFALESTLRDLARRLHVRLPRDLGWELQEIGTKGLQIVFVFARGEPGIDLLKIQAGSAIKRLGDLCRIHIVDSADHTFSRSGPRSVVEEILSRELVARSATPIVTARGPVESEP